MPPDVSLVFASRLTTAAQQQQPSLGRASGWQPGACVRVSPDPPPLKHLLRHPLLRHCSWRRVTGDRLATATLNNLFAPLAALWVVESVKPGGGAVG